VLKSYVLDGPGSSTFIKHFDVRKDGCSAVLAPNQKWMVRLLIVLDNMNAPEYAFELIIKLSHSAHKAKYSFHPPGVMTCALNPNVLFCQWTMQPNFFPLSKTWWYLTNPPCHVIVYDLNNNC
jgi:hypothetical protein